MGLGYFGLADILGLEAVADARQTFIQMHLAEAVEEAERAGEEEEFYGEKYYVIKDDLYNEFTHGLEWDLEGVPVERLDFAYKEPYVWLARHLDREAGWVRDKVAAGAMPQGWEGWELGPGHAAAEWQDLKELAAAPPEVLVKPLIAVNDIVMDGFHRFALAVAAGKPTVKAYVAWR